MQLKKQRMLSRMNKATSFLNNYSSVEYSWIFFRVHWAPRSLDLRCRSTRGVNGSRKVDSWSYKQISLETNLFSRNFVNSYKLCKQLDGNFHLNEMIRFSVQLDMPGPLKFSFPFQDFSGSIIAGLYSTYTSKR